MVFMGIDVGEKGSICILDSKGQPVKHNDKLCVLQFGHVGSTEAAISEWIYHHNKMLDIICSLERVMPRPSIPGKKFNVQSQFYLGENYGLIRGMLVAHKVNFVLTTPQSWQKTLGVIKRDSKGGESTSQFKQRLRELAKSMWPKLAKMIVSGNADSFLISVALRRQYFKGK